jgi:hypothetical protein
MRSIFDASGSWIRFRQSQARLQVLLAEFRFAWAGLMTMCRGICCDRAQAVEFVTLLREFVSKVELLAEEETKEWARRFHERIDAYDRNPNLKVSLDSNHVRDDGVPGGFEKKGAANENANGAGQAPTGMNGSKPPSGLSVATVKLRLAIG